MSDRLKAWAHWQRVNPVNEDSKLMAADVDALFARIAALEALVSEKDIAIEALIYADWENAVEPAKKALSLTQSHPRILAIGKVLGAAKGLSEAVNRDVDHADWNDRVYEAGTRLDVALAEYEGAK